MPAGVRLLFSRSVRPEEPVSPVTRRFIERLGALTLELPPLRSRSDEIPSLSSLYLNSLNLELGKQLSGFEPRAIEMLRQYPWPNNYHPVQKPSALPCHPDERPYHPQQQRGRPALQGAQPAQRPGSAPGGGGSAPTPPARWKASSARWCSRR